jgi:hypothetical protein
MPVPGAGAEAARIRAVAVSRRGCRAGRDAGCLRAERTAGRKLLAMPSVRKELERALWERGRR